MRWKYLAWLITQNPERPFKESPFVPWKHRLWHGCDWQSLAAQRGERCPTEMQHSAKNWQKLRSENVEDRVRGFRGKCCSGCPETHYPGPNTNAFICIPADLSLKKPPTQPWPWTGQPRRCLNRHRPDTHRVKHTAPKCKSSLGQGQGAKRKSRSTTLLHPVPTQPSICFSESTLLNKDSLGGCK